MKLKIPLLICCFFNLALIADTQIEEIITTGSILNNPVENSSPLDIIDQGDLDDLNIITIGEISKYISSSTGSQFQTNALDGTDQGMSSITLRGLDHTSTLVLINSKRQTSAGTTSNEGEGYVDINIIPQIALKQVHILKEGATAAYGSDAISGVVNFLTQDDFEGVKLNLNQQKTTNFNQRDSSLGILFGKKYDGGSW